MKFKELPFEYQKKYGLTFLVSLVSFLIILILSLMTFHSARIIIEIVAVFAIIIGWQISTVLRTVKTPPIYMEGTCIRVDKPMYNISAFAAKKTICGQAEMVVESNGKQFKVMIPQTFEVNVNDIVSFYFTEMSNLSEDIIAISYPVGLKVKAVGRQ